METYRPRVKPKETKEDKKATETSAPFQREGKRLRTQLRPMYFQTGVIPQASGSAYVEIGNTKIIVSVWGPRADTKAVFSDTGRLWCDFKFAPFAQTQRRKRGQDPDERQWSRELTNALSVSIQLDKFPKSVLEAYVLVLESASGVLPAAVTCTSLALASAGVELYDLVPACNVARRGDVILLDPDDRECEQGESQIMLAFMPSLQQVTHTIQEGAVEIGVVTQMMELALDGCAKMHALMKESLISTAKRRLTRVQQSVGNTPLKIPRLAASSSSTSPSLKASVQTADRTR